MNQAQMTNSSPITKCSLHSPSIYEGFGIPLLGPCNLVASVVQRHINAKWQACPAISTAKHRQHAFAIEKTICNSAEKALHSTYERVKQFSWNKCTLETIKVYQQLLPMTQIVWFHLSPTILCHSE
jgi:hypothetical protein